MEGGRLGGGGYRVRRDGTWTRSKAAGTKRVLSFRERTAYSILLSRFGRGLYGLDLVSCTPWSFSFLWRLDCISVNFHASQDCFFVVVVVVVVFHEVNRLSFLSNLCVFHYTMRVVLQY